MRHLLTVEIGGRYLVVPKLVGAMLIVISIILLLGATADILQTWDHAKDIYNKCLGGVLSMGETDPVAREVRYQTCILKGISAGIYVYRPEDGILDSMRAEAFRAIAPKVAAWLFWFLMLVISLLIYQTGKLLVLAEEKVEVKEKEKEEKEEAKARKKRSTRRSRKKR